MGTPGPLPRGLDACLTRKRPFGGPLPGAAKPDDKPTFRIDGYFYGLSKRAFEAR